LPPETGTALLILVAFMLPGFVTVLLRERTIESAAQVSQLDRLLRISYYSVWSYFVVAVALVVFNVDKPDLEQFYEDKRDDPALLAGAVAAAVLAASTTLAAVGVAWHQTGLNDWFRRTLRLNPHHQTPTAWDHFFSQAKTAYVKVMMADGTQLAGYYGPKSFAAYSKDGGDLYLEQCWLLDGEAAEFDKRNAGDSGLWIASGQAIAIEFYTPDPNGQQTAQRAKSQARPQAPEATGPEQAAKAG
jgi:hypothetical protein